jgi:DNA-directed RNA polymerase subunit RPC12/RpoP
MAEFKFFCPDCGQHIQCDTSYGGSQINCPVCQQTIVVPKPRGITGSQPPVQARWKTPMMVAAAILFAIVAGAGLFLFLKSTVHHAGLVDWWPADGSAQDSIGHHNGTLEGGVSFTRGKQGQAFLFNSPDAAVRIPANAKFNVGAGSGLTLEAWINPSNVSNQQPLIEWDQGVHMWIAVPWPGGGPGCLYANVVDNHGGIHVFLSSPGIVQSGEFQHVAVTYDHLTGNAALYYNGTVVATANLGVYTPKTDGILFLGHRIPGPSYQGILDEVGVYNRALSAAEIKTIYKAGTH